MIPPAPLTLACVQTALVAVRSVRAVGGVLDDVDFFGADGCIVVYFHGSASSFSIGWVEVEPDGSARTWVERGTSKARPRASYHFDAADPDRILRGVMTEMDRLDVEFGAHAR